MTADAQPRVTRGARSPERARVLRSPAGAGAAAGVAGGLVFGAAMASVGTLPTVASIVRTDSLVVGFVLHLAIAAAIGAGFGLFVAHQQARAGESLVWGLLYGGFWWFVGPLTMLPLLVGHPVAWDLAGARGLFPSLIGHLFYGGTTALVFLALRVGRDAASLPRAATVARALLSGVIAASVLYLGLDVMGGAALGWLVAVGPLSGLGYLVLFGAHREGAGPALIRGTAFGFLCWIVAELTVAPLLRDGELGWSSVAASAAAGRLPPYLLLGAGVAAVFTALGAIARWLFVDDIRMTREESAGSRGLRATGYGALAGLVGGLVFAVVMVLAGQLPTVAGLVGSRSPEVGFVVHLLIGDAIGISYALLFRGRGPDAASGIGWGVSYGFLWWVLGNLTLLPVLTGGAPGWNATALAAGFPSLVGHLAYGAALGVVLALLEARTNPWWSTRNEVEAQRAAMRRETMLGSAPALWGFTILVAVTIPLLIGG